jgi:hypothetical protein
MLEAVHIYETLVYFNDTKQRYITKGYHCHTRCHENLKSHQFNFFATRIEKHKWYIVAFSKLRQEWITHNSNKEHTCFGNVMTMLLSWPLTMESSKCSQDGVLRARHIAEDDAMALVKPRVAHSTWWFRANSCVCDGESDALFAVCTYKMTLLCALMWSLDQKSIHKYSIKFRNLSYQLNIGEWYKHII